MTARRALVTAVAVVALSGALPAAAGAHDVTLVGTAMDVGIRDFNGYAWSVEVKARIDCTGADKTHMGITIEMLEQYTQPGGAAIVTEPPPNSWHTETVFLPPGRYQVRFGAAVCHSTAPMPDGHEGDHGDAATNPPSTTLTLPNCARRTRTPVTPSRFAPLVPVIGGPGEMRAPCPARMCDAIASRRVPLVPVRGGAVPAPCPTISVSRPNVPVEIVCGPGAISSGPRPLLPVGSRCAGRVDLVATSAGVARASAARVLGSRRFKIRSGAIKSVRIPLKPAARTRLNLTRVLRMRAVVRSKGTRRKSKPFTVIKRR